MNLLPTPVESWVVPDKWDPPLTTPEVVACPACHAVPGAPCRNRTGKLAKYPHVLRRDELAFQRLIAASRPRIRWAGRTDGRNLLQRAAGTPCPLCSEPIRTPIAHLDHIVPLGIGGADTIDNLRVVCGRCNLRRPRNGSDLP